LNEFGYSATSFVPTSWLDTEGKLTWEQVENLERDYGWETGGHTLNHEDLSLLSYEQTDFTVRLDHQNLLNHGLAATSFALPAGHCPIDYIPIITRYYDNIRTSQDIPMHQPINRLLLGYCSYRSSFQPQDITDQIVQSMVSHEALIIIGFHRVRNASNGYDANCTPEDFRTIISWIHEHHLKVMTLQKAMSYFDRAD
jgi:peptidoglycan/xylan/chitin deacetylase (PgdA/CDA1 family)